MSLNTSLQIICYVYRTINGKFICNHKTYIRYIYRLNYMDESEFKNKKYVPCNR